MLAVLLLVVGFPGPGPGRALAASEAKPTCAVTTFEARDVGAGEAETLSDRFEAEIIQLNRFTVLSRKEAQKTLEEQNFSLVCSDTSCAIQLGKILACQSMIFGSIGKAGAVYTLAVKLVSVETTAIESSAIYDTRGGLEDLLTYGMGAAARKLLRVTAAGAATNGGEDVGDLMNQVKAKEAERAAAQRKLVDARADPGGRRTGRNPRGRRRHPRPAQDAHRARAGSGTKAVRQRKAESGCGCRARSPNRPLLFAALAAGDELDDLVRRGGLQQPRADLRVV